MTTTSKAARTAELDARTGWTAKQRNHLRRLIRAGATIAYVNTDQHGRPANGGPKTREWQVYPGAVQTVAGPLELCGSGALHGTLEPHRWAGCRVWVAGFVGEIARNANKVGALRREIIGEVLPEFAFCASVGVRLGRKDLTDADLTGAALTGADLTGADLRRAVLTGAVLTGAVLRGAVLRGAVLRYAALTGAVLTGAVLRGAVLRRAVLTGADLRYADLRRADLTGADLTGADLRGADLRGADLRRAALADADLRGADLTGAVLTRADLRGAVLRGATMPNGEKHA